MGLVRTVKYIRQRMKSIDEEVDRQFVKFHETFDLIKPHLSGEGLDGKRALDIGCGQMLPLSIGFTGYGAHTTGIDLDPFFPGKAWCLYTDRKPEYGNKAALSMLARNVLVDSKIQSGLSQKFPQKVDVSRLDIRRMNAEALDFEDNTFDLMAALAVYEHIADIPASFVEVYRVLKPGGVACLHAHLFPSLTGGHNREMMDESGNPLESVVAPWDHLRENLHPANCYLNKHKLADFRKMAEESPLDIAGWSVSKPGMMDVASLTPEIEAELAAKGYTREDLVTTNLWMLLKKAA